MYDYPPVVGPFSPRQPEQDEQRNDRHNAARRGPDPRILDRLGEGIEPGKPGFSRHRDRLCALLQRVFAGRGVVAGKLFGGKLESSRDAIARDWAVDLALEQEQTESMEKRASQQQCQITKRPIVALASSIIPWPLDNGTGQLFFRDQPRELWRYIKATFRMAPLELADAQAAPLLSSHAAAPRTSAPSGWFGAF